MDSVTVNGKLYKKATVLAKQFRYTTDYIGQLCRNKKVDCQFVGRSWYVTEASLLAHKDTRYKEVRVGEKTIKGNHISVRDTSEISVRPRLLKTATKTKVDFHFADRLIPRDSRYFSDEADLLPQPKRPGEVVELNRPKIIPIIPANAQHLLVQAEKQVNKLDFTQLPTVVLTGTLEVKEIFADSTPSVPVHLKEEPGRNSNLLPSRVSVTEQIDLETSDSKQTNINFIPKQVSEQVVLFRYKFLLSLSFLLSLLFFGFSCTAVYSVGLSEEGVSKQIIFEIDHLKKVFEM